ncbi:MAG: class I SAM-dependent methyltransferase [Caulobacteraceae bacterium]
MTLAQRRAFILAHTALQAPPHAPELRLHLADEIEPIWRMSEDELGQIGLPPPFWAFAWAGGQALARYLLDNPHEVAGKRVFDFATGSGLAALAAMKAGAAYALGNDIDPYCEAAVALNAEVNGVAVDYIGEDLLGGPPPPGFDVFVAGDICYEKPMTKRVMAWLGEARAMGARVLIGDPGRSYFPASGLTRLADYQVSTTRELEDQEVKRTGVWTLAG